ncbi:MAG: DNA repair protein RadC [Chitinophagaceae bacterium]|nr:DNA repair protein RadC [Chitinophagaceae bacterium]
MKSNHIKSWSEEDRPREKLMMKGPQALSHAELLAILINTGTRDRTALDIAREILVRSRDNLQELGKMSLTDIRKIKGMGDKKSITVLAALELGKRRQLADALENPKITTSRDGFNLLQPYFMGLTAEQFYVLYLSHSNRVVSVQPVSQGGITATVVDPRILFKKALELNGVTQMVMAHNHPSGNLTPSEADKKLTQKVKEAGLLLEIRLIDHLIISENRYYSFSDEGML